MSLAALGSCWASLYDSPCFDDCSCSAACLTAAHTWASTALLLHNKLEHDSTRKDRDLTHCRQLLVEKKCFFTFFLTGWDGSVRHWASKKICVQGSMMVLGVPVYSGSMNFSKVVKYFTSMRAWVLWHATYEKWHVESSFWAFRNLRFFTKWHCLLPRWMLRWWQFRSASISGACWKPAPGWFAPPDDRVSM